ncbi:MAG: porin [Cyclobacteriaceae bacterium]|nr:porin [Cyclobacteriaceae bacterium]MCH8515779.1 porin [Cyclobacteriaceae bacterium]
MMKIYSFKTSSPPLMSLVVFLILLQSTMLDASNGKTEKDENFKSVEILVKHSTAFDTTFQMQGSDTLLIVQDTIIRKDNKAGDLITHEYRPLTLNLSDDGKKYIRFIVWNQMWARHTTNNPGTLDMDGSPMNSSSDIGIRRARFLAFAQVSPRFLIMTHFGINNQSISTGGATGQGALAGSGKKPQIFFHDIWNEFMVIPEKLYIGSGLHYWNGISRMTNASTLNFMTLDAPIHNWATIELTDQFARMFGFYAKGNLGKLDYRMAINQPFTIDRTANGRLENEALEIHNRNHALVAYINYQFLDQESNKLPFMVGSYLGTKEVFNIGVGGHLHRGATGSVNSAGVDVNHDIQLLGADVFYEKPMLGGSAISLYSSFYRYDFGPNYIRQIGLMSLGFQQATDVNSFNGPGNLQPMIGTGNIFYTQLGYLFKDSNLYSGKFMPYVTTSHKNFDALSEASWQFDLGLNYFLNGHHSKITLQYSSRPLFDNARNWSGSAGEWILQTHFFL